MGRQDSWRIFEGAITLAPDAGSSPPGPAGEGGVFARPFPGDRGAILGFATQARAVIVAAPTAPLRLSPESRTRRLPSPKAIGSRRSGWRRAPEPVPVGEAQQCHALPNRRTRGGESSFRASRGVLWRRRGDRCSGRRAGGGDGIHRSPHRPRRFPARRRSDSPEPRKSAAESFAPCRPTASRAIGAPQHLDGIVWPRPFERQRRHCPQAPARVLQSQVTVVAQDPISSPGYLGVVEALLPP